MSKQKTEKMNLNNLVLSIEQTDRQTDRLEKEAAMTHNKTWNCGAATCVGGLGFKLGPCVQTKCLNNYLHIAYDFTMIVLGSTSVL